MNPEVPDPPDRDPPDEEEDGGPNALPDSEVTWGYLRTRFPKVFGALSTELFGAKIRVRFFGSEATAGLYVGMIGILIGAAAFVLTEDALVAVAVWLLTALLLIFHRQSSKD